MRDSCKQVLVKTQPIQFVPLSTDLLHDFYLTVLIGGYTILYQNVPNSKRIISYGMNLDHNVTYSCMTYSKDRIQLILIQNKDFDMMETVSTGSISVEWMIMYACMYKRV